MVVLPLHAHGVAMCREGEFSSLNFEGCEGAENGQELAGYRGHQKFIGIVTRYDGRNARIVFLCTVME